MRFANTCFFRTGASGTDDFSDGTAQISFRNLTGASLVEGQTYSYRATNPDDITEWENGLGTYASSGPFLQRTTIYESSNSDAKVNFSNAPLVFLTPLSQTIADLVPLLLAGLLTAGVGHTPYNAGTKTTGTFTPDYSLGLKQYCVNGGAFQLDPPSENVDIELHVTNNGSAGAITTTSWDLVDGDDLTTVDGDEFILYLNKINDVSHLTVKALP